MKNNFTYAFKNFSGCVIPITVIVILILNSCKKEYYEGQKKDNLVLELKNWANSNIEPQSLNTALFRPRQLKTMNAEKGNSEQHQLVRGDSKLLLQWDHAKTYLNGNETIVEVPIITRNIFLFNLSAPMKNEKIRKDKSLTRIVFIKNAQKIESFFITFIFDETYLTDSNSNPERNTYIKQESNFLGSIIYHNINGNLMRGLYIKKGTTKDKGILAKSDPNNKLSIALPDECREIDVYEIIGTGCFDDAYYTYCENIYAIYLGRTSCGSGGGGVNPYTPPGGGGGGGGGSNSPAREIIDSLLNNCMKDVKDILITQNGQVNALLRSFTDDNNFSPNYTWILKNNTLPETDLAATSSWDRTKRNVTTEIDDAKFTNASDLAIAKTLLHEGLHAYLIAYFANDPLNANKEYSVLFDAYISAKNPDLNELHHNEMARKFVEQISFSLREFGNSKNYQFSSNYEKERFYDDLAWGGLFETKAFKALPIDVQDRIKNVISTEQKGEDVLGNKKIQKGKTGGCK